MSDDYSMRDILRMVGQLLAAQRRYSKSTDKADFMEAKRLEADIEQFLRDENIWITG